MGTRPAGCAHAASWCGSVCSRPWNACRLDATGAIPSIWHCITHILYSSCSLLHRHAEIEGRNPVRCQRPRQAASALVVVARGGQGSEAFCISSGAC